MVAKKGQILNPKGRGGRPNKVTREMRTQLEKMLKLAAPHMIKWVAKVANGYKYKYIKKDGTVVHRHVRPNPGKAFEMAMMLAEYSVPKLSRIDMADAGNTKNTFLIAIQNNLKEIAAEQAPITGDTPKDDIIDAEVIQG